LNGDKSKEIFGNEIDGRRGLQFTNNFPALKKMNLKHLAPALERLIVKIIWKSVLCQVEENYTQGVSIDQNVEMGWYRFLLISQGQCIVVFQRVSLHNLASITQHYKN
jgi:hypothetical protein